MLPDHLLSCDACCSLLEVNWDHVTKLRSHGKQGDNDFMHYVLVVLPSPRLAVPQESTIVKPSGELAKDAVAI